MMNLIAEGGVAALVSSILFVVALVLVVQRRGGAHAMALAILACGLVGDGVGQRLVARAVEGAPDDATKIAFLAVGTSEATANLIVSGALALLLVVVNAAAKALRGPNDA